MDKFAKSQSVGYLKQEEGWCGDSQPQWAGKAVDPAVRNQRDPVFYQKMWVCKSAPFIISLNKLPAADGELLGCVCMLLIPLGLLVKNYLVSGCAKINLLRPLLKYIHSVPYLIQMHKKPFAASLLVYIFF